jgi:hypothetical protein
VPSNRENGPSVTVDLYDVIAEDGNAPGFIIHTGLAFRSGEHDRNKVEVSDMGPPLNIVGAMRADAVGKTKLTDGEIRKIKVFVDIHEGEHQAISQLTVYNFSQVYCIMPHATPLEENDRRYVRMRFSCAGFVFEAYRRAGITLLDESRFPLVTLDEIKNAYPRHARFLDKIKFRESLGLAGLGPWPVMFCGYLINSLKRDDPLIRSSRHVAQAGDKIFL